MIRSEKSYFAFRPRPQRLDGLQAGRMVAAILVVIYHANNFILPMRIYGGEMAWPGFGMGYAGVEFFFVLSGFIMAHIHMEECGTPRRIPSFLRKRFTRIFPTYWIVLSGLVLLYSAVDGLAPEGLLDPRNAVTSYLLIPDTARSILPVAWTLKHEVVFYLVFAIFLINLRLAMAVFAFWMLLCVLQMLFALPGFAAQFFLSPYNVLFIFGLLTARFYRDLPTAAAVPALVAGMAGFLFVGMSEQFVTPWNHALRTVAYGVSAAVVIAALSRGDFVFPGWTIFLGNASFAIYLTHLPAMNALAIPLAKLGVQAWVPPMAVFVPLAMFGVCVGAAFHVAVERPLLARLAAYRRRDARATS